MNNLRKKGQPDRSKINMHEEYEVKHWTKEFGVSREQQRQAVDKRNSAAVGAQRTGDYGHPSLGNFSIVLRIAGAFDFLHVISGREYLTSFLICYGHICHQGLRSRPFPNFLFGRKRAANLRLSSK